MVTQYAGVFCAKCRKFIILTSRQVERPDFVGTHFDLSQAGNTRCPHCGDSCVYAQADLAYSTSPDGKEPRYLPKR
jgi:hypothetical protein